MRGREKAQHPGHLLEYVPIGLLAHFGGVALRHTGRKVLIEVLEAL